MRRLSASVFVAVTLTASSVLAQGLIVPGAGAVNLLHAADKYIQEMKGFERRETFASLADDELVEQLALDQFADQAGHILTAIPDGYGMMVLNYDRTFAQTVQLGGVEFDRPVVGISLWKENLRGALDARRSLDDLVYFALPPRAKLTDHGVPAGQNPAGLKVE